VNAFFPILDTTNWRRLRDEQMGSKTKHWCRDPSDQLWLFKFSRPNTGKTGRKSWRPKSPSCWAFRTRRLNWPFAKVQIGPLEKQIEAVRDEMQEP
jgi:hypothetical protein